ncbi:MAG TPA: alpha/beta hydrolase [Phenylobacterium sp.]|nr:alpha/beta hydrolase [Phenylobacterium sp.]
MVSDTPWRKGWVEVAGGRLAYHRTGGSGPVMVLAHGLTDNGLCWSRLANALQDRFDVILLDARGHGESARISDGPPHDPGMDLVQACEALGLAAPIIVGHSVGARAALDFAALRPDGLAALVLEDPPLLPLLDAAKTERRRLGFQQDVEAMQALSDDGLAERGRQSHPTWDEGDFPAWRTSKRQVDPRAYPEFQRPWQAALAAVTVPTLLVCGTVADGSLVKDDIAAEASALNPRLEVVRIEGAGHNTRRENFPAYLDAVSNFLSLVTGY